MTPTHFLLRLCALFIVGQLMYILKRAAYAVRNPQNQSKSRRDYLYRNWDVLLLRAGGGQIIFWVWTTWPDGFTKLMSLASFGHLQVDLTIPLKPIVAVIFGLVVDVGLDMLASQFPRLDTELPKPSVNGQSSGSSV